MSENSRRRTSKFLSYALRHAPEEVGLSMNEGGWVPTESLIAVARREGYDLDRKSLRRLIRASEKKRFELSSDGEMVRATYGHSVDVDLDLTPVDPPDRLYHGTAARFLSSIDREGLRSGSRKYVHLSETRSAAREVGARHGRPVVLVVDAAALAEEGHPFFRSGDGVWMTREVSPEYLTRVDREAESPDDRKGESSDDET